MGGGYSRTAASVQQAKRLGACHGLSAALDIELAVDVPRMGLDRMQGDEQAFADLLVRVATGDQLQDSQFTRTEPFARRSCLGLG